MAIEGRQILRSRRPAIISPMAEVPGKLRRSGRAPLAARIVAGLVAAPLLLWAYVILDNIWNYNDSGTLTYVLYALVPALLGVLCMYLALRGWRRSAKRE